MATTRMSTTKTRKRQVEWPTTAAGWCNWYTCMDLAFLTQKSSPLHHDNRCPIHGPKHLRST